PFVELPARARGGAAGFVVVPVVRSGNLAQCNHQETGNEQGPTPVAKSNSHPPMSVAFGRVRSMKFPHRSSIRGRYRANWRDCNTRTPALRQRRSRLDTGETFPGLRTLR